MKHRPNPLTTFSVLLAALGLLCSASAVGPLNPPGAPAAGVYKTLNQVEPRIDLATIPSGPSANFLIEESGNYYLSEDIEATFSTAISIAAPSVQLDLNGFSITRTSSASATAIGTAIRIEPGVDSVTIKNGKIYGQLSYDGTAYVSGPGFTSGILLVSADPDAILIKDLVVSGIEGAGIQLGAIDVPSHVINCEVSVVSGVGITAGSVTNCRVFQAGSRGIEFYKTVRNCYAEAESEGIFGSSSGAVYASVGHSRTRTGIRIVQPGSLVYQSTGTSESSREFDHGITAARIIDSYGAAQAGDGIRASSEVVGSEGRSNSGNGIFSSGSVRDSFGLTVTGLGNGIEAVGEVSGSSAESDSGAAIKSTSSVRDSVGISNAGTGIEAETASQSRGVSNGTGTSAYGIIARDVQGSEGISAGAAGIFANEKVSDSSGRSTGSFSFSAGIAATSVHNSQGRSDEGIGIDARFMVVNSVGRSFGSASQDSGIQTDDGIVSNSHGTAVAGVGIRASTAVENSTGESFSNLGIRATTVTNSFGRTTSGSAAIFAFGTAANCRADHLGSGDAIVADIASACTGVGGDPIVADIIKVDGTP